MRSYTITETLQSAAVATGIGTVMDTTGMAVVSVQVTIAGTATITFEAALGGGTMTALPATNMATGAAATTATATGIYLVNISGLTRFQARISAWSSGAVAAIAAASTESGGALSGASGSGSTAPAPAVGTYTERSTTITTGGTAQDAMSANTARKAWFFQNIGSADLWISFVETAAADTTGSIRIAAGASAFSSGGFVSTQALSIVGATTGQKFTLWES